MPIGIMSAIGIAGLGTAATAGITAAAIGAEATGYGAIAAAHETSSANEKAATLTANAADYAANQQAAATAAALAFSKQQAENSYQNDEVTRKANYDQWAAGQTLHNSVRDALGYGSAAIPAYVPGVDPNFNASTAGAPPAAGYTAPPTLPTYSAGTAVNPTTGAIMPPPAASATTAPPSVGAALAPPATNPLAATSTPAPIVTAAMRAAAATQAPPSAGAVLASPTASAPTAQAPLQPPDLSYLNDPNNPNALRLAMASGQVPTYAPGSVGSYLGSY